MGEAAVRMIASSHSVRAVTRIDASVERKPLTWRAQVASRSESQRAEGCT